MRHFISGNLVACDTETTGLDAWHGCMPFAFSFTNEEGESAYVVWPVDPFTRRVVPDQHELKQLRKFYEDPSITKVWHNAKFDIRMLEQAFGIHVRGRIHDTFIAARVCNTQEPAYGLKPLAVKYLDFPDEDQKELQKHVVSLRRAAKKLGWSLGEKVVSDYWLVNQLHRAFCDHDPDVPPMHSNCDCAKDCKQYAVGDTERTMLLWQMYRDQMRKHDHFRRTYRFEMKLWHVTYDMETRGVKLDIKELKRAIEEAKKRKALCKRDIDKAVGHNINLRSPQQLCRYLYDNLKLPHNTRSVKAEALNKYRDNLTVRMIQLYRALDKGISFLRDYRMRSHKEGGIRVVHPQFDQAGAGTGRYSCRYPNMQNVPNPNVAKTASIEDVPARTVFVPRKGYYWLLFDYAQMELRIFASLCNEQTMIDAFLNGRDVHDECANRAWGGRNNPGAFRAAYVALDLQREAPSSPATAEWWHKGKWDPHHPDEKKAKRIISEWLDEFDWNITKAEKSLGLKTTRAHAKMVMFAKVFGGGGNAVKGLLGVSLEEARQFLREINDAFPRIDEYNDEVVHEAKKTGMVLTAYGRPLQIPKDRTYCAINYGVQGSAADHMKHGMYRCDRYFKQTGLDVHLVLTVHDEIVFEVSQRDWDRNQKFILESIRGILEDHGGRFKLPMPTTCEIARKCWAEKEVIEYE